MSQIEPYTMAACRVVPNSMFVDGRPDRGKLLANIDHTIAVAERVAGDHGAKLIVFPQFGISGHAMVSSEVWHEAALEFPGPELDRIGAAARRMGASIVVQAPERHAAFPGRYFLSCAIIAPDGNLALVHRKSYSLSLRTSPIDVYSKFIETFGEDAFFPVIDTPLGRMAATIGAEPHWPEACRSLALKGAEVIVNPIAAAGTHLDYLERAGAFHVRATRAFENMVYLATPNFDGGPQSPPSTIYDFKGEQIGKNVAEDTTVMLARVDIPALRKWREEAAANFLAQIQPQTTIAADMTGHWPSDRWPDHAPDQFDEIIDVERDTWRKIQSRWGSVEAV